MNWVSTRRRTFRRSLRTDALAHTTRRDVARNADCPVAPCSYPDMAVRPDRRPLANAYGGEDGTPCRWHDPPRDAGCASRFRRFRLRRCASCGAPAARAADARDRTAPRYRARRLARTILPTATRVGGMKSASCRARGTDDAPVWRPESARP